MIRIPNFTKTKTFYNKKEAYEFAETQNGDADVLHWAIEDKEWWNVCYCSNGYFEYPDPKELFK